ncbi:hypothetical protein ABZS66_32995 [Dactylosporangium sp. NPDC005572]|uniref:hypothetical protein n=1 Tax=Dactylosporangium sp. NPDC005572 TaxID=3156889 RepID=UPI0033B56894
MPERETPRGLQDALDDFHAEFAPRVMPPGSAAVHTMVRRRRRRNRVVTVAATLVAAGLGSYALLGAPAERAVDPSTSNDASTPPAASASASATSPSAAPPSASESAYGRMSREELAAATVDLPAWSQDGCPSGRFTFHGESTRSGTWTVKIEKLVYPDVDGDGSAETAALLSCTGGEAAGQVVVFDRDSSGAVTTVGRVVRTGGAVKALFDVAASGAQVQVELGDYRGCCGESEQLPQHQWRSYTWSGTAFQQVDGPRSFPPNPNVADLSVTATDLVWGTPDSNQSAYGTVTVTIRNHRGGTPQKAVITFHMSGDIYLTTELYSGLTGWNGCTFTDPQTARCPVTPPAPGATREMTFEFRHGAVHGGGFTESVRIDARLPDGTTAPDLDGANNQDQFMTR